MVCATMTIHNFIRKNSQTDVNFIEAKNGNIGHVDNISVDEDPSSTNNATSSSTQMNQIRDTKRLNCTEPVIKLLM